MKPGSARDEEIEPAVVVVVGLGQIFAAQLAGEAGGLGAIFEGAVAGVVVKSHGLDGVEGRHGEIEPAIVVEIIHDGPTGHIESVDPRQVADVAELADIELRLEVVIKRDQEARINFCRMLAQRHVGHVQEPA